MQVNVPRFLYTRAEKPAALLMLLSTSEVQDGVAKVSRAEQPLRESTRRQHLVVLIPILMIYFLLAFYRIDHQSLWTDEVTSVIRSDPSRPLLLRERLFAGQSPPYFLLLHLWAKLGTSEFALRSLSAILGGITVCLTYITALQLCNRRVAWIGATLLATSPFLIWYSQEVRYVMLMILMALLAMYAFDRALFAKRFAWWLCHCCSLILAIVIFVVNVLLSVAQGLYLVCAPSRRPVLRRWVLCQLVVFAFFLWWANHGQVWELDGSWKKLFVYVTTSSEKLPSLSSAETFSAGSSRKFTLLALPYTFFAFSTGFSLGPSLRELHVSHSLAALLPYVLILSTSALLFGTLFILGITSVGRQSETRKFLLSWLAVPILGALSISALIPGLAYNVRYVAMGFPAYIFILALGIASLRRPFMQMALFTAVLAINGLSLANYYHNPRYSREDARSAARYLEAEAHAGDIIAVVGNATALRYYYHGSLPIVGWGKTTFHSQAALIDPLQELSRDHEQLWLVETRPWEADPEGLVKTVLNESYQLREHKALPGVDIYSYRLHRPISAHTSSPRLPLSP
jgi:4-amino-4-deoxy-L-arabinose transferase-like glycosyltransferase